MPEFRAVFYGRLEEILECVIPDDHFWSSLAGTTLVLALITPISTKGADATEAVVFHRDQDFTAPIVVDLRTIQAPIGRVKKDGQWGIIDLSLDSARTIFSDISL